MTLSFSSWRYLAFGIALALAGCASMSEKDCRSAQWQDVGLQDGLAGEGLAMIENHRQACAKTGVVPDVPLWLAGRNRGLASYCTANGAWTAGLANRVYKGVCADRDEAMFLRYHRAGLAVWRARHEISGNRDKLINLEGELKKAANDSDRRRLRDEISRSERERDRLILLLAALELAGPPR